MMGLKVSYIRIDLTIDLEDHVKEMAGKNGRNEYHVELQVRLKLQRHTQGLVRTLHSDSSVNPLAKFTFQP